MLACLHLWPFLAHFMPLVSTPLSPMPATLAYEFACKEVCPRGKIDSFCYPVDLAGLYTARNLKNHCIILHTVKYAYLTRKAGGART